MLFLSHPGDHDWPWPFEAEQHIFIGQNWLELRLIAKNTHSAAVPLAFGIHPYFNSKNASLRFEAADFYPSGADNLPLEGHQIGAGNQFEHGRAVSEVDVDNLYGRWLGIARIDWEGERLALEITSDLPHAVVYTPVETDFFCFEPVPHINNAINRSDGDMPVIEPDENFVATIRFCGIPA